MGGLAKAEIHGATHPAAPVPSGTGPAADPRLFDAILRQAEHCLHLRRVWLFGSRARGDARPDSDIDLAFEHASSAEAWAGFVNAAHDETPVLLHLDLVDFATADPALRERILKEGTLLRG